MGRARIARITLTARPGPRPNAYAAPSTPRPAKLRETATTARTAKTRQPLPRTSSLLRLRARRRRGRSSTMTGAATDQIVSRKRPGMTSNHHPSHETEDDTSRSGRARRRRAQAGIACSPFIEITRAAPTSVTPVSGLPTGSSKTLSRGCPGDPRRRAPHDLAAYWVGELEGKGSEPP